MTFKPIDFNQIARDTEMDLEDVIQLMDVYETELKRDLTALEQHLNTQNHSAILEVAHKIKGDSSNLTLSELEQLARTIEKNIQNDHCESLTQLFQQMTAFHLLIKNSLNLIKEN